MQTASAGGSVVVAPALPASAGTPLRAEYLLLGVWLAGVVILVGRAVLAHAAVARLVGRSQHLDADLRMEVDASIDVRLSPDVDGPFTLGAIRPVILLPVDAQYWSSERLRIVLVHEAAHVARLDYIAQLIGTLACGIYWFNPIVWLAVARLRAEAEHAADDRVLAAGVDGVTYASHLLELARPDGAPFATAMAVGMARGTNRLEKRFTAMLDSRRSRGTVPLRLQVALGSAAMLAAIPITSIKLVPPMPKPAEAIALAAPAPLAVVAPAVLASASAAPSLAIRRATQVSASQADTIVEQTIAASAGETISINLRNGGSITVRSWNQPQVRLRGVLSGTEALETRVIFGRTGSGLELRTVVDNSGRRNSSNSNSFELWVPSRFNVDISSGGGEISISGVEGRFSGGTGGGEINLDNVKGVAELTTGGGEVTIRNSALDGRVSTGGGEATVTATTGNVRVSSGSGPVIRDGNVSETRVYGVGGLAPQTSVSSAGHPLIVVDGNIVSSGRVSYSRAGGEIRLESVPNGGDFTTGGGEIVIGSIGGRAAFTTGGGDVTLNNVAGDVSVTTGAGDVQISVVSGSGAARNVSVASGKGRVVIELPADFDGRLDLETAYTERNGPTRIESDFPVTVTETQEWDGRNGTPRRYVRGSGSVGAGRGVIRIRTVNGDVVIRRK
jgi:beta-lactamase regulating signal transducer with metallopeptidase domain